MKFGRIDIVCDIINRYLYHSKMNFYRGSQLKYVQKSTFTYEGIDGYQYLYMYTLIPLDFKNLYA